MKKIMLSLLFLLSLYFSASSEKFSVILVPDTQMSIESCPSTNDSQFVWLARHKDSLNIKYISCLGDLTNHNTAKELASASHSYKYAEAATIPVVYAPGNHDGPSTYSRFCSTFSTKRIDSTINKSGYSSKCIYYPPTSSYNSYVSFVVGGVKYGILSLQCAAGSVPATMTWANQVCAANQDRKIILVTHAFLNDKKVRLAEGEKIWSTLVNKHSNIFLVACGHYTGECWTTSKTSLGNSVVEMLIDQQYGIVCDGRNSLSRILEINTLSDSIKATTYSAVGKKFLTDSKNKFAFKVEYKNSIIYPPVSTQHINIKQNASIVTKKFVYNLMGKRCQRTSGTGCYILSTPELNYIQISPPSNHAY